MVRRCAWIGGLLVAVVATIALAVAGASPAVAQAAAKHGRHHKPAMGHHRHHAARGPQVLSAFSDAHALPSAATVKLFVDRAGAGAPAGKPLPLRHLGLARAIAHAKSWLHHHVRARALRAFAHSRAARNEGAALAGALAAITQRRPDAALAALLRAHALAPRDPLALVDAAPVLTLLGMPNEALAFLRAARRLKAPKHPPLGIGVPALELNGQGYALLALRRPAPAVPVLRKAVERAPLLSEARRNLAAALAATGKKQQAIKMIFLAVRRSNAGPMVDAGGSQIIDPRRNWNLAHGASATFPDLHLERAATPAGAAAFGGPEQGAHGYYTVLGIEGDQRQTGRSTAEGELLRTAVVPAAPVTRSRVQDALAAMGADVDPALHRKVEQEQDDADGIWNAYFEGQCAAYCRSHLNAGAPATCRLSGQQNSRWLAAMKALQADGVRYAQEAYERDSAIAANFANPKLHRYVLLVAQDNADADYYATVVGTARHWADAMAASNAGDCLVHPPTANADHKAADEQASSLCHGQLGRVPGVLVDLFVVKLRITCETVGAEIDSDPWLGFFGKVGYNFRQGTVTVFGGLRAGVKFHGVGGALKGGVYVTVGSDGFEDAGVRGVVSGGSGPLSIRAPAATLSFTGAVSSPVYQLAN